MCMMVYLAADQPLRTVDWDVANPAFAVGVVEPDYEPVRRQLSKAYLYVANSHEGCGCGFQLGEWSDPDYEAKANAPVRRSLRQFAEYLEQELPRVGEIEVLAAWAGEEGAPIEHQRVLTPGTLRGERFAFLEGERSLFVAEKG